MRDINRIRPFLNEIKKIWEDNPDLRFTQLIVNLMTAYNSDMYYIEDDKFLEKLKQYYK